ncbi:MAG: formate dehydrogenase subunit gamma [Psychromonas sp.]|nr:formate dehydrogenase subunit gamma [Psychromonas sp.]
MDIINSPVWLSFLSHPFGLPFALFFSVFGMIILMGTFVLINGISKLEKGFSGKLIERWTKKNIIVHWFVASFCICLIISGLVLGGGKIFFTPGEVSELWIFLTSTANTLHRFTAIPFILASLIFILMLIKHQFFKKYDIDWFLKAGGYINFGKVQHPDAGFVNAGEKVWFWTFLFSFLGLMVTGLALYFPEIAPSSEIAPFVIFTHVICAIVLSAFSVVHVYMATIISEGGMSSMLTGKCDENWAKQHHNKWVEELKQNKKIK